MYVRVYVNVSAAPALVRCTSLVDFLPVLIFRKSFQNIYLKYVVFVCCIRFTLYSLLFTLFILYSNPTVTVTASQTQIHYDL